MGIKAKILLALAIIAVLANLPTFACILSHTPSGEVGASGFPDTSDQIISLTRCATPTGTLGIILFIIGGVASGLVEGSGR